MTDIMTSGTQFILWLCLYLASRYNWNRKARILMLVPLMTLVIWQLFSPIQINIDVAIGAPLNQGLRLASVALIILYLFTFYLRSSREDAHQ